MSILAAIFFAAAQIDLSGDWRLTGTDAHGAAIECAAAVPGDVHSALLGAKLIPDPFWGCNETNVQWVGKSDWTLTRAFDVPAEFLAAKSIVLRLSDVDTFATVRVNGETAGETCNRFRRWEFDVKRLLKPGRNTIAGEFRSAWNEAESEAAKSPRQYPCYSNGDLATISHIRKPQCHGGWDWGITQMTAGFCGPVKLIASQKGGRVEYVYCDQKFSDDMSHCTLTVFAEMSGGAVVTNVVEIDDPPLWWPAGQGEQMFYEYEIDDNGVVVAHGRAALVADGNGRAAVLGGRGRAGARPSRRRIGLRKIEMVNEEDAVPGRDGKALSCYFRVNGRPVFAKGANWIPCDAFDNRQTPERYRDLLSSAAAANMNMIRLWGGGQYEKDVFYDLCDELGLMVWHDFMFACANYPGGAFLDNVREEVVHQVKRLRDHACIALWCGDNECRATWHGSWPCVKADTNYYHGVYLERIGLLRALVARHDPARTFWPGSPCNGPDDDMTGKCDPARGDLHYWSVWHGGQPFRSFGAVTPRFCSEFGFQSYPSRETCLSFCRPEDLSLDSPVFDHHQKNKGGNKRIRDTMRRYFREPRDFDGVLYLSQVQQALAIKTAVELWRARRPVCMGTLYWQLNDNWPVSSWSSIEYGGRWKQLHYHAKRFFANVAVLPTENPWNARQYELAVANDGPEDVTAELTVEPWRFDGKAPRDDAPDDQCLRRTVTLPSGQVARFGSRWGDHGFYVIRFAGAENVWFSAPFKDCDLAPAKVEIGGVRETVSAGRRTFVMEVATDYPAFFVWLSAPGVRGEFSDNSFTLLPGRPRMITFTPKDAGTTLDAFRAALRATHFQENCRGRDVSAPGGSGSEVSPGLKELGLGT